MARAVGGPGQNNDDRGDDDAADDGASAISVDSGPLPLVECESSVDYSVDSDNVGSFDGSSPPSVQTPACPVSCTMNRASTPPWTLTARPCLTGVPLMCLPSALASFSKPPASLTSCVVTFSLPTDLSTTFCPDVIMQRLFEIEEDKCADGVDFGLI